VEKIDQLQEILSTAKTIAVVGLTTRESLPSYSIPAYLQGQGYRIIPVNPHLTEALGEKAYASVADIPEPVDIVDIFRRPEDIPPVVEDAIANGAKVVWMQLGIRNEEAAARAREAGLTVIQDNCIGATHRRLKAQGAL
jgi:uncharacterized protein